METRNKERVRGKSVLLFSGGMDSICYAHLLKPDVLLFIDMNSNYDREEKKRLFDIVKKLRMKKKLVVLDEVINLKKFERDDYIIPNRNAYLILLASMYGEKIIFSSVDGDRSLDKDKSFYKLVENLLNHMWKKQHWTEKRVFKVVAPYKNLTKTKLVKKYLVEGGNPKLLLDSYSCYSGVQYPCGQCKPCFRKWVALSNNKILNRKKSETYFVDKPWKTKWLHQIIPLIKKGKWRGKEDNEIISAIRRVLLE